MGSEGGVGEGIHESLAKGRSHDEVWRGTVMGDMKIILAPDSFKESISAADAAQAMARGVKRACDDGGIAGALVDQCPVADGGEGTVAAMLAACDGQAMVTTVRGPMGEAVEAAWGYLGGERGGGAVIEMATASGLALVDPAKRDPLRASTFGTGQLIRAALERGAKRIIIGIGGSATNDGGCGMAQALGARFYDGGGQLMADGLAGGDLERVARIEVDELKRLLGGVTIEVACDVTNPLTGANGASAIYGPQKGATPAMVQRLDAGLAHLATLWREQLGADVAQREGAGAAGGLGGGLIAFTGATLRSGAAMVLDAVGFESRVVGCDLCLTGEGRLDGQSLSGKLCMTVARCAAKHGVPTIALVGSADDDADRALVGGGENEEGLEAYHVIGQGLSVEESMRRAGELLEQYAFEVVSERLMKG